MTDDPNRPESGPSSPRPQAISLDKGAVSGGPESGQPSQTRSQPNQTRSPSPQTQEGGRSPWADVQAAAIVAGHDARAAVQSGVANVQAQGDALPQGDTAQKRLVAGLLGIFLGSLGVHKFYLGINQPGIIMLVCTLAGYLLFTLLAIVLIGFVFLLLPSAVGLVGLIEGILYLTKSDADFQREYVVGKKPWF